MSYSLDRINVWKYNYEQYILKYNAWSKGSYALNFSSIRPIYCIAFKLQIIHFLLTCVTYTCFTLKNNTFMYKRQYFQHIKLICSWYILYFNSIIKLMHPSTYKCFYKSKIFRKLCLQFGGLLRRKRGAFLTHSMLAFYS